MFRRTWRRLAGGRKPALPAVKWWRVAKRGPVSRSLRTQTPGLMRLNIPVTAVCFFRLPSPDNGKLQLGQVTPVETQVATQIGGLHDGTTGLRIRNLPAAVSDWFSGSVGDLRRMGSTSGSPKNRPNGVNLQHWPGVRPSGPPGSSSPGTGLISVRSGGLSLVFRPGWAHRHKSIDMDCRYVLGFPFWESNWRFRQPPRSKLGVKTGA